MQNCKIKKSYKAIKHLQVWAKENTHLTRAFSDFGWGNGYVIIPEGHPLHGMHYDKIHDQYNINVHGGLTFSELAQNCVPLGLPKNINETSWVIGFDTCHYGDSITKWPDEESVLTEANYLADQCTHLKLNK